MVMAEWRMADDNKRRNGGKAAKRKLNAKIKVTTTRKKFDHHAQLEEGKTPLVSKLLSLTLTTPRCSLALPSSNQLGVNTGV